MLHATCVNTPICLQQCVPLLARCLLQGALHPVWTGPEHDLKNCLWMDNSFLYTYRSANLFQCVYYNVQKACIFMKWLSWHLTHWPCMHFLWAKKTDKKFYSPRNHWLEVHTCTCICLLCVPWMPEFISTAKEWQFFFNTMHEFIWEMYMAGPFSSFLLEVETIWCHSHCNNFACKGHDTQDEWWCTKVFFQQHYKYDTMQQPKFALQSILCVMTLKVNWHWPFGSIGHAHDTCIYAYAYTCTYTCCSLAIIQACRECDVHIISVMTAKQLHICSTQNVNSFVIN